MVNDVGNKLYVARKQKGLTMKYIADMMGVAESTVKRYEDGHIKGIPYDKLRQLANLLGISVGYILGFDEVKPETNELSGLTEEELQKTKEFILFLKSQRK